MKTIPTTPPCRVCRRITAAPHLIALALPLLLACNDIVTYGDDDYVAPENRPNTAPPAITGIYEVRDIIGDTPLDTIDPGQRVRITGSNLSHVKAIDFNGIEADVAQAAATLDYCIVTVPEGFTIGQNTGISYTTDRGTTAYDVVVRPQPLCISGLANAFTTAGSEATVCGRWFHAYGFANATNNAEVTLFTPAKMPFGNNDALTDGTRTPITVTSATDEAMNIAIPADAPDNSLILFTWKDADGTSQQYACHYRPTAYRCFDTLNLTTGDSFGDQQGYDLAATVEEDGTDGIPQLGAPILRLAGRAKQWGWYSVNIDSELHTPYAIAGENEYDATRAQGYLFQFEVMTLEPMPSSADADVNGLTFSMEWGERTEWSPAPQGEQFTTNAEWRTVSLNLSDVAQKGLRPVSWGGTTHLGIILSPIVDNAAYNLRLSNFRIVSDPNGTTAVQPN